MGSNCWSHEVVLRNAFAQQAYVRQTRSRKKLVRLGLFGMPRIKPEHERCVFFLINEMTGKLCGTGFFVGRVTSGPHVHIYGVTNHHTFVQGGRKIQLNTKNGGARVIDPDEEWEFSSNDDLAVIDLTDYIQDDDDYSYVVERDFITEAFAGKAMLGIGDEVFLIGMFSENPGGIRNHVSGRFGSLSMMASADSPVAHDNYPPKPSFIADMRSRPGYSGSPVFVYRTPWVDLRTIDSSGCQTIDLGRITDDPGTPGTDTFVKLLGVHCAQYHDFCEVTEPGEDRPKGRTMKLAGAMTIIIPVWRVQALLDSENFKKVRLLRDRENASIAVAMNEGDAQ